MRDAAMRWSPEYGVRGVQVARRGNRRPGERRVPYAVAVIALRTGGRHCQTSQAGGYGSLLSQVRQLPYTAILRCRTGAPVLTPSAASMMALASMPWWR